MKRYNYKSDWMSRKMDKQLELLEDKLTTIYANASYEVNAEFAAFAKTYAAKDAAMIAKLEAGEITKAEYALWAQKAILQTDLYKATVDSLTGLLLNADIAALAAINNELPFVIAQSYDFVQSLGFAAANEAGLSVGTFQIYNADSVQFLIRGNPELFPKPSVDIPVDKAWNKQKINAQITTSIMRGDSIDKVAAGLQKVTDMDKNAAVRNARTAMTAAENAGRTEAARVLQEKGVPVIEEWACTHDNRTRDTHIMLDGERRDENGVFGASFLATPLRFPADPLGDPEEVYNCRCRLNVVLAGIDHTQDGALYEQFMAENYPENYEVMKEKGMV